MRAALAALLLLGAAALPASGATRASDPPRIVPWHLIGNIGLGMSRARVERLYGRGHVESPPTTDALVWRYRGRGGIGVEYDLGGHVAMVETSSSAYASRSGIQVGAVIRHGPCHRVHGVCVFRWHGLSFAQDDPKHRYWWRVSSLGGIARVYVEIAVGDDSTVDAISLTQRLHCRRSEIPVAGTCHAARGQEQRWFYFPPPPGLRYCEPPGGPGNFVAASPAVSCALAIKVRGGYTCTGARCRVDGFLCFSRWSGVFAPIQYTNHAVCTDARARRVAWDGG